MIDIMNKKCITCHLKHHSLIINMKKRLYCKGCKLKNMVNTNAKKCVACNFKNPCSILQMKNNRYIALVVS